MLQFPWIGLGQPPESKALEGPSSSGAPPLERPRRVAASVVRTHADRVEPLAADSAGESSPSQAGIVSETAATSPPAGDGAETSEASPPEPSGGGGEGTAAASDKGAGRGGRSGAKAGGKRKIVLDEDLLIEGKLEKPSAFFILRRSAAQHDWARLQVQFAPLVYESVQDPLF